MSKSVVAISLLVLGACASGRILLGAPTCRANLRLFNPAALGASVDEPTVLLHAAGRSSVGPVCVLTDIKDGKYTAATVTYPASVTLEETRDCIDSIYGQYRYKGLAGIWRIEKDKFTIALDRDEHGVRLIYLAFQPSAEVLRDMMRAGVLGSRGETGNKAPDAGVAQ
jgi:hypothetical protein